MKIGLYFGSFNPIHNGHLVIANYMNNQNLFDQIWLVVSPNNPLKNVSELAPAYHRLNMAKLAIQNMPFLKVCDVEFHMQTPSYTIDTLEHLRKSLPLDEFALILGSDNIDNFHQWKDYKEILKQYILYVYPRKNKIKRFKHNRIVYIDAPLLSFSSTDIRSLFKQKKPVDDCLPASVIKYINKEEVY